MLSRFSSLFAYVVVGLVISAAATPMVPSSDHDIDAGSKSPSRPDSAYSSPTSPMYPTEKRPEGKNPKDNFPEAKPPSPKGKPHAKADDQDKASGDRPQAHYPSDKQSYAKGDDKDQSHADHPEYGNQCNVDKQVCCNGYNESKDEQHSGFLQSLDSYFGMTDVTRKIRDSNKFWSTNCSKSGVNSPCKAQPMCCEENHWEGLIVIGCTNVNVGR